MLSKTGIFTKLSRFVEANVIHSRYFPYKVLVIGLLIRLILMPFAAHSDFIHTWWASSCISQGTSTSLNLQSLLFWLHSAYLQVVGFLLPSSSVWCNLYQGFSVDNASMTDWFTFINQSHIFRILFVLKLPYLLFDLGCGLLLYNIGSAERKSAWSFSFWWLNPIPIYAIYIIGRHESIAIFFMLFSLFLIQRQKYNQAYLVLGIAIAIRYYPLFLLPFYIFSIPAGWKDQLKRAGLGLLPWIFINVLTWAGRGNSEVVSFLNYPFSIYLLPLKLSVAPWDNLLIFPFAYFILLLHRIYNTERNEKSLYQYSLMAILFLQALTYMGQAPHYWVWSIPFIALVFAKQGRILLLHLAQITALLGYGMIGSRATAGYLFASISPKFFWSLPSPIEWLSNYVPPELVISLAHTAFSALMIWMIYLIIRQLKVNIFDERTS